MPVSTLAMRMVWAALLTALFAAVLVAIGMFATVAFMDRPQAQFFIGEALAAFGYLLFFNSIVAVPSALIIGLLIEWPKSVIMKSMRGGLAISVIVSMLAGLMLAFTLVEVLIAQLPDLRPRETTRFFASCFAVGGVVSANVWWRIVVKPWRGAADA